jgi:hypothetical protein
MKSVMGTIGQIQLKGTTSVEKQYTLDLPVCWKRQVGVITEYIAVLNEKTAIRIFLSDTLNMIENALPETMTASIISAFEKWEEIPDGNFLDEYENALKSLSLNPSLAA